MAASKLQQQLRNTLGWDEDVLQDVVQSITQAGSKAEVEELAQNFMEGNEAALKAVKAYTAERFQPLGPARPSTASQPQSHKYLITAAPAQPQKPQEQQQQQQQAAQQQRGVAGDGPGQGAGGGGWRQAQQQAIPASVSSAAPAAAMTTDSDGKVFGIFKQGGRVKVPTGKASGEKDKDGKKEAKSPAALAASVERSVVNCLGCGKIYHTRNTTNPDIVKFLERRGLCTFCGTQVSLTYRKAADATSAHTNDAAQPTTSTDTTSDIPTGDSSASQPSQPPSMADRLRAPKGLQGPDEAAVSAAIAFKDRLVMYDRESAKRTNVIDDQSDFFDVDSNAWLTDEERQQIKEHRRVEAAAEAARKSRVAITIDLLGRRVLAADPNAALSEGVSFRTNDDNLAVEFDPKARNVNAAMWHEPAKPSITKAQETAAVSQKRPAAGSVSKAQSDSAATDEQQSTQARIRQAAQQLKSLRIAAAPSVAGSKNAPRFVHAADTNDQQTVGGSKRQLQQQQKQQAAGSLKGSAGVQAVPRLQHDIAEVFEDFGTEVLFFDLEQALESSEPPFDLCPLEMRGLPPMPAPMSLPSVQNEVHDVHELPPGVTLLRGWLTPYMQTQLINNLRQLGIGPGGFYQPSYGAQAQMHLHMMCLGMHWEPKQHTYMSARPKDGAIPPPVPPYFKHLCSLALKDATQMVQKLHGLQLPSMTPEVCVVNHYDARGTLGMHQDKDESSESLRAGLPVVSFSLGDAADFIFSSLHDAVTAVYSGTTPTDLVQSTGLRPGRVNLTFRQL